jgi:hypothetical protein
VVLDGCGFWLPPNSNNERSSPEQVALPNELYRPPHTPLGAKIISDKSVKRAAPLGRTSRLLEAPDLRALYSIHTDLFSDKKTF